MKTVFEKVVASRFSYKIYDREKKRAFKNVMLLAKSHVVTVVVGVYTLVQQVY